eukprot:TRINITY_DN35515_c0_g2_i1.p1 TRINITY_DN35515_c0_g2~~TRINITY_DN35515_c0_g2_i1.p1  ORF type:complete len:618 (-),score=178.08 TRINITY_DN35515_c0_g2_i1:739-2592(-)
MAEEDDHPRGAFDDHEDEKLSSTGFFPSAMGLQAALAADKSKPAAADQTSDDDQDDQPIVHSWNPLVAGSAQESNSNSAAGSLSTSAATHHNAGVTPAVSIYAAAKKAQAAKHDFEKKKPANSNGTKSNFAAAEAPAVVVQDFKVERKFGHRKSKSSSNVIADAGNKNPNAASAIVLPPKNAQNKFTEKKPAGPKPTLSSDVAGGGKTPRQSEGKDSQPPKEAKDSAPSKGTLKPVSASGKAQPSMSPAKQPTIVNNPSKPPIIPAKSIPPAPITESSSTSAHSCDYRSKCEILEKKLEEFELVTNKLINEGQLWRYRANRNKALYIQVLRALAEEGIAVKVEGDKAEFSDEDVPDSPKMYDEKRLVKNQSGSLDEQQPFLKGESKEMIDKWMNGGKADRSRGASRAHKASTVGRAGKPVEFDALAAGGVSGVYGTARGPKKSTFMDREKDQENSTSAPNSPQEDELPEEVPHEDDLALAVIAENLKQNKDSLPELKGYLQKKSPTMLRGWQKRYFWVKDFKLFYAPTEVEMNSIDEEKMSEKLGWNSISLVTVHSISAKPDSADGEFNIRARDPRTGQMRNYVLKADTNIDRDRWVRGLNTHRDHLLSTLRWAGAG